MEHFILIVSEIDNENIPDGSKWIVFDSHLRLLFNDVRAIQYGRPQLTFNNTRLQREGVLNS